MEKVFTNVEHAEWLREQARLKRPYWYGTYHNSCTESLLEKKRKQYPTHYTSGRMDRYRADIAAEQIAADCVGGAIKGAVWSELGKRAPKYASHGCADRSADGMFAYCKSLGMEWGTIDTMPDRIGLAVRFAGHVGVYVGDGEVVEWRGFAYGCVVTKLNNRKWLHWYELPWVDYIETGNAQNKGGVLGERLLKKGMTGSDVKAMQEMLIGFGYELVKYGADGDFGAETEVALKAYQTREGLEADGKYGAETHAAFMADIAVDVDGGEATAKEFGVTVTGNNVYVRTGASTGYDIITVVHKGDVLSGVATADNGWHCVKVNGGTGWISGKYTNKE